jgi:hypothetical protein
VKEDLDDM